MCENKSTLHDDDARTVVSDRGDTLSPKYAPEMIAPAIHPSLYPITLPIPWNAMPIVAIVVHELPDRTDITAHTPHAMRRNIRGFIISKP